MSKAKSGFDRDVSDIFGQCDAATHDVINQMGSDNLSDGGSETKSEPARRSPVKAGSLLKTPRK